MFWLGIAGIILIAVAFLLLYETKIALSFALAVIVYGAYEFSRD